MSILGFNFKADIEKLRELVIKNKQFVNQDILDRLKKYQILGVDDIEDIFNNIKELYTILIERVATSKTIQEYNVYNTLYKTLMVTEYTGEILRKSDGTIATTYIDYISDADVDLFAFISNVEMNEIDNAVEHILIKLDEKVLALRHSYYINSSSSVVLNALIKLINFFKSYTTDLTSFNILYVMDNRYTNMIHMISQIVYIDKELFPHLSDNHIDDDFYLNKVSLEADKQVLLDEIYDMFVDILNKDDLKFNELLSYIKEDSYRLFLMKPYNDILAYIETRYYTTDRVIMYDTIKIIREQ